MNPYISDTLSHHAANTAAIAIPIMAFLTNIPLFLTIVTGCMGIVWYGFLFLDRYNRMKKERKDEIH